MILKSNDQPSNKTPEKGNRAAGTRTHSRSHAPRSDAQAPRGESGRDTFVRPGPCQQPRAPGERPPTVPKLFGLS